MRSLKKYLILRKLLYNDFRYDQLKSIKFFIITRIRIIIPQYFIKYSQKIISQFKLRNIIISSKMEGKK